MNNRKCISVNLTHKTLISDANWHVGILQIWAVSKYSQRRLEVDIHLHLGERSHNSKFFGVTDMLISF